MQYLGPTKWWPYYQALNKFLNILKSLLNIFPSSTFSMKEKLYSTDKIQFKNPT